MKFALDRASRYQKRKYIQRNRKALDYMKANTCLFFTSAVFLACEEHLKAQLDNKNSKSGLGAPSSMRTYVIKPQKRDGGRSLTQLMESTTYLSK